MYCVAVFLTFTAQHSLHLYIATFNIRPSFTFHISVSIAHSTAAFLNDLLLNKFHISLSLLFQISLFRFHRFCFSVNFSNTWVCFIFVISNFIMPRGIKGSGKKPKLFPTVSKSCEGKSEIQKVRSVNQVSFNHFKFSVCQSVFSHPSALQTHYKAFRDKGRDCPVKLQATACFFLWFWAETR